MKLFRVVVSFDVDAEDEHDAIVQAMREGPSDCVVEAVRELPEPAFQVVTFPTGGRTQ